MSLHFRMFEVQQQAGAVEAFVGQMSYLCDPHPETVVVCLQAVQPGRVCLVDTGHWCGCLWVFFFLVLGELQPSVLGRRVWVCPHCDKLRDRKERFAFLFLVCDLNASRSTLKPPLETCVFQHSCLIQLQAKTLEIFTALFTGPDVAFSALEINGSPASRTVVLKIVAFKDPMFFIHPSSWLIMVEKLSFLSFSPLAQTPSRVW